MADLPAGDRVGESICSPCAASPLGNENDSALNDRDDTQSTVSSPALSTLMAPMTAALGFEQSDLPLDRVLQPFARHELVAALAESIEPLMQALRHEAPSHRLGWVALPPSQQADKLLAYVEDHAQDDALQSAFVRALLARPELLFIVRDDVIAHGRSAMPELHRSVSAPSLHE